MLNIATNASNWWLCENSGTRGGEATSRKLSANAAGNWATSADSSSQNNFSAYRHTSWFIICARVSPLDVFILEKSLSFKARTLRWRKMSGLFWGSFSVSESKFRLRRLPRINLVCSRRGRGEFSCRPITCSRYRCLHNSAITGITSHRSMWQNLVNPNISPREEITLLQSTLVKEGMTRDICCLAGVKGFYGSFFFSSPPSFKPDKWGFKAQTMLCICASRYALFGIKSLTGCC